MGAHALLALSFPAPARADECGDLRVPGYTAERTAGPLRQRVASSPLGERIEDIGGSGRVQILLKSGQVYMLNPSAKVALAVPTPSPPPMSEEMKNARFIDRELLGGGLTQVTVGFKSPEGKKEWIVKSKCRPDGIWVEKQLKSPQGVVTQRQTNINPAALPRDALEVPSDYQLRSPPR